jgi:hypothetical protein
MSIVATLEKDGKEFVSVMKKIQTEASKTLVVVEKYLPEADALASVLFPQFAPEIAAGSTAFVSVADLIQKSVAEVEQKASALPAGLTNEQKAADVLSMTSSAVIALLKTEKITAGTSYVQSLVNAAVSILDVPAATPVAA